MKEWKRGWVQWLCLSNCLGVGSFTFLLTHGQLTHFTCMSFIGCTQYHVSDLFHPISTVYILFFIFAVGVPLQIIICHQWTRQPSHQDLCYEAAWSLLLISLIPVPSFCVPLVGTGTAQDFFCTNIREAYGVRFSLIFPICRFCYSHTRVPPQTPQDPHNFKFLISMKSRTYLLKVQAS